MVSFLRMDLTNKSASRYILVSLAIILVITAFILVGLNAWQQQQGKPPIISNPFSQQTVNDAYAKGYLAARAKYAELCPQVQTVGTTSLIATITSINGGQLKVTPTNLDTDPIVDHVANIRTITIDSSTQMQKQLQLTPDEVSKQLQAFADQIKKNPTATPPSNMTLSTFADFKVGQTIQIQSSKDVRLLETIPATSILILK